MLLSTVQLTADQRTRIEAILGLDLESIVWSLTNPQYQGEPPRMSLAAADQATAAYRRFLVMLVLRPELPIVPTQEEDTGWHEHQSDSQLYRTQLGPIFGGQAPDHFPYFGRRGPEDQQHWLQAVTDTAAVRQELFGLTPNPSRIDATNCFGGGGDGDHGGGGMCVKSEAVNTYRPRPNRELVGVS